MVERGGKAGGDAHDFPMLGLQRRARDTVTPEKKALIQRTKTSHINENSGDQ